MTGGYTGDAEVVHIAASILVSIRGIPEDDTLVQWLLDECEKPDPDPLAVNFSQNLIEIQAAADRKEQKRWTRWRNRSF